MIVALIHWRIRPDEESIAAFLNHWQTNNTIGDRSGLMAEFLSDSLPMTDFPYITWHLDAGHDRPRIPWRTSRWRISASS